MSYMKRYYEQVIEEIMDTFSGQELVDKLRATFGYSDSEISAIIAEYGRE